jgi:isocitrate/isopropylmalate dehydrogenase
VGHAHAAANAGHGSAPDIAGRNIANPLGLLLSAAALLDWHGSKTAQEKFRTAAGDIYQAVDRALADPATRTGDLGGGASTSKVAEAVAGFIA